MIFLPAQNKRQSDMRQATRLNVRTLAVFLSDKYTKMKLISCKKIAARRAAAMQSCVAKSRLVFQGGVSQTLSELKWDVKFKKANQSLP